jgi:hypothetical protein
MALSGMPRLPCLDLTPQGRGDWYADLSYGTNVRAGS